MSIDFTEDAMEEAAKAPSDKDLSTVSMLCERAVAEQLAVQEMEAELKERKAKLRELLERDLPDTFTELGLSGITMKDGRRVEIVDFIDASPRAADRPWVCEWLREHGLGDLVKNDIVASFGAGDDDAANAVALYMEEHHINAARKVTVHPQTLKAQVRKWLTGAEDLPCPPAEFPEDRLGVYRGRVAKFK